MEIGMKSMGVGLAAFSAAAWLYELYEECLDVIAAAVFPSGAVPCSTVIGSYPLFLQIFSARVFVVAL